MLDLELLNYMLEHPLTPGGAMIALNLGLVLWAAGHAVLYKRDSRSAMGWVGIIWLVPFVGPFLYWMFGINRVQRRALRSRGTSVSAPRIPLQDSDTEQLQALLADAHYLGVLAHQVERMTGWPLLGGNQITPLESGEVAYEAMLDAIGQATQSVALSSYIFDNDPAGQRFVAALAAAQSRGVEVRVIIDDLGARYSVPSIEHSFHKAKVPLARFMRSLMPWRFAYANLRCHRKLLIVDGRTGFTGGMNIRQGYLSGPDGQVSIRDLHFKLTGPVVTQLQQVFAGDWEFCTDETLSGESWFPDPTDVGPSLARGIVSGPDADHGKLRLVLLAAIATAQKSVQIVTPYFLPDAALITALNVAALRGVNVQIVLPATNNLRLVRWACAAQLWQVLEHGSQVWFTEGPFDHTKLMLVDGRWSLFGSGNWDPRSLRLNFEFDVESYDLELAQQLSRLIHNKLQAARQVSLKEMDARSLPVRLRDGIARLFSPYL